MPYPPAITLRPCTLGGSTALESGTQLVLSAEITASRSLRWGATGWQFPSLTRTVTGTEGAELSFSLPVTDLAGWRLNDDSGSIIDVSAPGSYTHTYTIKLKTLSGGRQIDERTIGPFVLPTEDLSPIDLDIMLPAPTIAGGVVLVPGTWDARVAAAEAAVVDKVTKGELSRNAHDFGAVGDGVTDDTDAIQAWLDAGGNLYLPPGTYLCNGATRPRLTQHNTTITGAGAGVSILTSSILYEGTPANDIDLLIVGEGESNPGLELENITIQGVGFHFAGANPTRGGGACLRVSRSRNVRIRDCSTLYGSIGIHLERVEGFTVTGCDVGYSKADGIQGTNGSDALAGMTVRDGIASGNYVHHTNDDAIAFGGTQDGGVYRSQPENITITGNVIGPVLTNGGGVGIYGVKGAKVSGNRITNPRSHFISVLLDNQYNQYPSENIDITDNDCYSNQTPGGGNVAGPVCMYVGGRNAALTGAELDVPLVKNLRIAGNRFVVNDRSGIWCQPNASLAGHPNKWLHDVVIENNEFRFIGAAPEFVYRGIHMQYVNGLTIRRNTFSGFPHIGVNLNQFIGLRFVDNLVAECVANAAYSSQDMVSIGAAAAATDSIFDMSGNAFRRTSGTVNRVLYLRAGATAGAHPYQGNRFFTTGATITTAVEAFQDRPKEPVSVAQSGWDRGHIAIGTYRLWVDGSNRLRIKNGAPASDTDGTVVGTQT